MDLGRSDQFGQRVRSRRAMVRHRAARRRARAVRPACRPRRSRRTRRVGDDDLGQRELGMALDQVSGQPVGLPRGGAVADRDQLRSCGSSRASPRMSTASSSAAAARAGRWWRRRSRLPVGPVTATSGRSGNPGQADRGPRARRGGQAAGHEGWRRRPGSPRPRPTRHSRTRTSTLSRFRMRVRQAQCPRWRPATGRRAGPGHCRPKRSAIGARRPRRRPRGRA